MLYQNGDTFTRVFRVTQCVQVIDIGDGDPRVAVVGGIHGDEPCGPAAIRQVLAGELDVDQPVRFIIANEKAADQDVRYVDCDLNRAFPGNPESDAHEERLAARLLDRVGDCEYVLSLHSTRSTAEPFALAELNPDEDILDVVRQLPVTKLVECEAGRGTLVEYGNAVDVECGRQGSDSAVDNAVEVVQAFLRATGVVSMGDSEVTSPVERFRLDAPIPKPGEVEVVAENFERVDAGEVYARSPDGDLRAGEAFYPVLMSADGYADILGYRAERV